MSLPDVGLPPTNQDFRVEPREWLAAIITSSDDAIISKTLDGVIRTWNQGAERIFGYTADEVIDKSITILIPENRLQEEPMILSRLGRGERVEHFETIRRRKDGREVNVSVTISPIRDGAGHIVGISKIARDITEQKRIQRELAQAKDAADRAMESAESARAAFELANQNIRESQRKLSRLVDSNLIGVSFCDEKRVLEANDAYLRLMGFTRADMEAGQILWRELCPPEYQALEARAIAEVASRGACTPFEKECFRKDGSRAPVLLGITAVNEGATRYAFFAQDLTLQRQAQADKAALLESERAARGEAERASRLKDEFLATLSHELRTPLNAILGWAQLMVHGKLEDHELHEGFETIARNARLQSQLIDDLLDMSRIISGKLRLDIQPVNPANVIEAAIDTIRPSADAKGISLQPTLDPVVETILADPNRLQQIIWNLLSNAIKYTPRGGTIRVTLDRLDSQIEINVADNGEGIPPEFLPHVFERFRQLDGSTTRRHGGLGLGLSIVKHLAELHGGTVWAKSAGQGQGTTFTIHLPLTLAAPRDNDKHPAAVPHEANHDFHCGELTGLKVLVVDDEKDSRQLVSRLLEECQVNVLLAASAAEALQILEHQRPDILVSDIGMPDVDGYDLLRQIRALGESRGGKIPAIALTAFARSEDRTRALRAGYLAHVAKPLEPAELVATIAAIVGRTA